MGGDSNQMPDHLSLTARSLWGKSDYGTGLEWLPLYAHMHDSALVAGRLWDAWVPPGTRSVVERTLGADSDLAKRLFVFLAGVHDIGKATPGFQSTPCGFSSDAEMNCLVWKPERAGLPIPATIRRGRIPKHPVAGQVILERLLCNEYNCDRRVARSAASVIGCHHGTPPSGRAVLDAWDSYPEAMGFGEAAWEQVQRELVDYLFGISGISSDERHRLFSHFITAPAASLLSGLVIMVDWIASNQVLFPLVPLVQENCASEQADLDNRFLKAWEGLALPPYWQDSSPLPSLGEGLFERRFSFPPGARPYPVQSAALDIALHAEQPGLLVIEAPMGEGKTEAALAAAEVLAIRTGRGGVCVALPTMATTDAMFGRVHRWLDRIPQRGDVPARSIYLAHGKAQLNEEFQGLVGASRGRFGALGQDLKEGGMSEGAVVATWMQGRKRGVLANFVVCTVDQVLMGALQMRHLALRQLALANKVVIIDECHAYDDYMRQYLCDVLEWLGSWRAPVILLSATLPRGQREEMTKAYLRGVAASATSSATRDAKRAGPVRLGRSRRASSHCPSPLFAATSTGSAVEPVGDGGAYPLVTYTSGSEVRSRAVERSGRGMDVTVCLTEDGLDSLVALLADRLEDGGCAGVICGTVARAQDAARALASHFGRDAVHLTHARFIDIDRLDNERRIREMLGPQATKANGRRPQLCIVVGTQVLEQSLDIDFDLLVTDVAPIDLLFQRMGRMHRHRRGEGEGDRPVALRHAKCFVRGIESWNEGLPAFAKGLRSVYEEATMLDALGTMHLTTEEAEAGLSLPEDIARLVQIAYGDDAMRAIPGGWQSYYAESCLRRADHADKKRARARRCLLLPAGTMCRNERTLTDWYVDQVDERGSALVGRDADRGQRAVRDTQETIEVMVLREGHGEVRLLPWIGNPERGVAFGDRIPTETIPDSSVAQVAVQSSLRLPLAMCAYEDLDVLIEELERMDADKVGVWQQSPWLAGRLALFLKEDAAGGFEGDVCGWRLRYTREKGLEAFKPKNHCSTSR